MKRLKSSIKKPKKVLVKCNGGPLSNNELLLSLDKTTMVFCLYGQRGYYKNGEWNKVV